MVKDIYVHLRDSYTEIQGAGKQIAQFEEDLVKGKLTFKLPTKPLPLPLPKPPVKLTKNNLKKHSK